MTVKERKSHIIKSLKEINDEKLLQGIEELLAKALDTSSQDTEENLFEKYAKPIDEKTDWDEIVKNQHVDYEAFKKGVKENDFFQDMTEEELLKMLRS